MCNACVFILFFSFSWHCIVKGEPSLTLAIDTFCSLEQDTNDLLSSLAGGCMLSLAALVFLALVISKVDSHGAMTYPRPRGAVDSDELPLLCPIPSHDSVHIESQYNLSGHNGQACYYFSNGCSIGCSKCDGNTRGPLPKFECLPGATDNGTCRVRPVPGYVPKYGPKAPICGEAALEATICDPALRTVNTGAVCGGDDDFYYYSPWRRPGSAPVIDACGSAGGRLPGQGVGEHGTNFQDTAHAKVGDAGSRLTRNATRATRWRAGEVVEVAWALQANHAGGYSYRYAPDDRFISPW